MPQQKNVTKKYQICKSGNVNTVIIPQDTKILLLKLEEDLDETKVISTITLVGSSQADIEVIQHADGRLAIAY